MTTIIELKQKYQEIALETMNQIRKTCLEDNIEMSKFFWSE